MKNILELNQMDCSNITGGDVFEVGSEIIWFFADIFNNVFVNPLLSETMTNPMKL
jgi:hypothetical protein